MLWFCRQLSRWMAVVVLLVAAGALLWPEVFGVIKTSWINTLLGAVMFGMGLTLKFDDFKVVFMRPKDVLLGCVAQFTIMPLLAYALSQAFQLPPELAVGVVLVGCCPGGTSSNVITFLAGGDLALSVGMTACSTLLAPFLTPIITWLLAGTYVQVDMFSMFLSILQVVILPVGLGLVVKKYAADATQKVTAYLPAFSTLAITLIVAAVVSANSSKLLTTGWLVIVVVVLHNVFGYALGYGLGWLLHLPAPKRTAISVEVGMQNSGLACSLATQHFQTLALATVPGAVFSVWHNISGALYARLLSGQNKEE